VAVSVDLDPGMWSLVVRVGDQSVRCLSWNEQPLNWGS
jgi:hypothetical protein